MDMFITMRLVGLSFNAIGAFLMHKYKIPTEMFFQENGEIVEPVVTGASTAVRNRIRENSKWHKCGSIGLIIGFGLQFLGLLIPNLH